MRAAARIFAILGSFAVVAAIVFPILSREPAGSMMLGVFALSMLFIARELSHGANADRADDAEAKALVGPEHVFPSSWWPPVMAVAIAVFAIGIRFTPVLVGVGAAILLVSAAGWFLQHVEVGHPPPASEVPAVEGTHDGEIAKSSYDTTQEAGRDHA